MSAIPSKLIARAKSYDVAVFESLCDSIGLENYSIPLLESILTHFRMEKLPKATSHSALESLFKAKPMLSIVTCLSLCLDNCHYTNSLLQSTAAKIQDCIEGIIGWTLLWFNHEFSPKSKRTLAEKG